MSRIKKAIQPSTISFDQEMHDFASLQAGRYGQSLSTHLNIILYYLEKLPKKDIDIIVEKGLLLKNKKQWQ